MKKVFLTGEEFHELFFGDPPRLVGREFEKYASDEPIEIHLKKSTMKPKPEINQK